MTDDYVVLFTPRPAFVQLTDEEVVRLTGEFQRFAEIVGLLSDALQARGVSQEERGAILAAHVTLSTASRQGDRFQAQIDAINRLADVSEAQLRAMELERDDQPTDSTRGNPSNAQVDAFMGEMPL